MEEEGHRLLKTLGWEKPCRVSSLTTKQAFETLDVFQPFGSHVTSAKDLHSS